MIDVALLLSPAGVDFVVEGGDLRHDPGLATAVLQSLYCDALADRDEAATEELGGLIDDRRGWWADDPQSRYGSKLWLLHRQKRTEETRRRAEEYAANALQWLVDEGIADRVITTATWDEGLLKLDVGIVRGASRRWDHVWRGTEKQLEAAGALQLVAELEGVPREPTPPATGDVTDLPHGSSPSTPRVGWVPPPISFGGLSLWIQT